MSLFKSDDFAGIKSSDKFEVKDHMVYRNGKRIPYIPHDKRAGRKKIDVKFFVYHFTAGRDNLEGLVGQMKSASTKADVHLCLSRSGKLVQMAPLNEVCWHAGQSKYGKYNGLNSYSCGIEVTNPGPLEILGGGNYKSWFGVIYKNLVADPKNGSPIIESTHKNLGSKKMGWLAYSPEQIEVMENLSKTICDHYGAQLVGHDEITNRKSDPGPMSQIDRMRANIKGRQ